MILTRKSLKPAIVCCALLFVVHGVAAFTVGSVSVTPSGYLYPGNSVNISYTVYAASGAAFPSYDDLQFITELDDPKWTYSVVVNGVKNTRPVTGGRTLTINGFELGYRNQDEVTVQVVLRGSIPSGTARGANKTLVTIQELDARGYSIAYSAVAIDRLIGEPTPPPTLAYGSITITSSPSGADIYIDNVYKGLSPALFRDIPNGNHVVLIKLDGYQDLSKSVTVTADNQTVHEALYQQTSAPTTTSLPGQTPASGNGSTIPATSGKATGYGSLSITTTPEGALVYVDGAMMGVTPATIPMLAEGPHSVTLVMDGYQDLKTTITVNPGTTAEYITGLSKTTKVPGFAAGIALLSIGGLFLYRKLRE
ncbi:MAG: PEGA domain-containing protein [Methanoregulaceae archaeon]|nr:MAG: PEGA domain-containing protein [Methanoregulaceae archaeon]